MPPLEHPSNDHVLSFDLAFAPSSSWQIDTELEFADTPRQSMGYRSVAFQVRYLWMDDLLGDPVSWTTGGVIRGVSKHSLKDVGCPYHADINFEISTAIGREWDRGFDWRIRLFGGAVVGMANCGYPWMSGFASIEGAH